MPINVVSEGKILQENIKIAKVDEDFVKEFIKSKTGCRTIKKVLVMTIDKNGKVFLQLQNKEAMIFENVRVLT